MLTFQLEDGKQVLIERAAVEEKLLISIFNRLDEARQKDKGMYTALKTAVNMMMTFTGHDLKIPKGENVLEYLIAHYASLGLDALEQKPLAVAGKIVEPEAPKEEAAPSAETN